MCRGHESRDRWVVSLSIALLLIGLDFRPRAAAESRPNANAPGDPVFQFLTIAGESVSGRIRNFDPSTGFAIVTFEGAERALPLNSLVKATRDGIDVSLAAQASLVILPEGDRIASAAVGTASDTTLEVQSYSLGNLPVPLENLLGIVFGFPPGPDALNALVSRIREEPRRSEALWLVNNDQLSGTFQGLGEKTVDFRREGQKVEAIERPRVLALGFDPTLVSYPKPRGALLSLMLSDGSRLGVEVAGIEQGSLAATTRFGAKIKVPLSDIARAYALTPSVVYLADRKPLAARTIAYVGPSRPFRRDATVEGLPFKLAGQEFDRGIGTRSRTLLVYEIEPGDKRFQATVGLDDRAGPLGSVVFRVLADRSELFASPPMSSGEPPRRIDVELVGAKRLILITEFGQRGDVRDVADWIEARVIR